MKKIAEFTKAADDKSILRKLIDENSKLPWHDIKNKAYGMSDNDVLPLLKKVYKSTGSPIIKKEIVIYEKINSLLNKSKLFTVL